MSTKTSKLVTEIDERVIYEDGKPKTVSLSGSDIPLALTKGRAHGDIKIDGEIFKSIESQALYFVWREKNPGVVGFFLEVTYEGGRLRISGDELETNKSYDISADSSDVDVLFDIEGVTAWPHYVPQGTLHVREATKNSIDGNFSFGFKNNASDDKREITFICNVFSLNISD